MCGSASLIRDSYYEPIRPYGATRPSNKTEREVASQSVVPFKVVSNTRQRGEHGRFIKTAR